MAQVLFDHVASTKPELYQHMQKLIQPHSMEIIIHHFQKHLEASVPDLQIFNEHADKIPDLCLGFVEAIVKRFPCAGDAFGIHLTCRVTKADTQHTLDSKHLKHALEQSNYNVDSKVLYELKCFTNQAQVFELASRRGLYTVFTNSPPNIPEAGILERGGPFNKARTRDGQYRYLNTFPYLQLEDRVLYNKDLFPLLRRLKNVYAFSDLKFIYEKCGLVSFFFNLVRLVDRQLTMSDVYRKDVMTIIKYQCCTGRPLPLTREGLSKNPERSPIEVLSFEAPKSNFARLCTMHAGTYPVEKSFDKLLFGQQFNEGTGYFALKQDARTQYMS